MTITKVRIRTVALTVAGAAMLFMGGIAIASLQYGVPRPAFVDEARAYLESELGSHWAQLTKSGVALEPTGVPAREIETDAPQDTGSLGGLLVYDADADGRREVIVTKPGYIGVFALDGRRLWSSRADIHLTAKAEDEGLPGLDAPGVQLGDIDGDGRAELVFLTPDNRVTVLDAATGATERVFHVPAPPGAQRWEHLVLASFTAPGATDLLLQATNSTGYRMGRFLAAFRLDGDGALQPLWQRDDFIAMAHSGARVADLDGDGLDEVLGGTLVGPSGERLVELEVDGHLDAVMAADVLPDRPGLEVIGLEEGGNRVFVYGADGVIWIRDFRRWEPQNVAVGDFDPDRPGLEIWCRSRFDDDQQPFVFGADGAVLANYRMNEQSPPDWTIRGIEVINTIDWTGAPTQLIAAKERHASGDVAVIEPLTGRFLFRVEESADRLYVADVLGDGREELVVLSGRRVLVYANPDPAVGDGDLDLWADPLYRRSKMTFNYYNP